MQENIYKWKCPNVCISYFSWIVRQKMCLFWSDLMHSRPEHINVRSLQEQTLAPDTQHIRNRAFWPLIVLPMQDTKLLKLVHYSMRSLQLFYASIEKAKTLNNSYSYAMQYNVDHVTVNVVFSFVCYPTLDFVLLLSIKKLVNLRIVQTGIQENNLGPSLIRFLF